MRPEDHLDIVHKVAGRLRRTYGADRDELVGDGMVALVLAARSYDPSRGIPFGDYAAPRVRWAMIDGQRRWLGKGVHGKPRAGEAPVEPGTAPSAESAAVDALWRQEVRLAVSTMTPAHAELAAAVSVPGGRTALAARRDRSQAWVTLALRAARPDMQARLRHLAS